MLTIDAPHFNAGVLISTGRVIKAAPIIGYMADNLWCEAEVRAYCRKKGWRVQEAQNDREEDHKES